MKLLKNSKSKYFLPGVLFSGTFILFAFFYEHHLWQREQLQLFQFTADYLCQKFSVQGGLANYLGGFLTGFFHIPLVGGLIISSLLLLLYRASEKLITLLSGTDASEAVALVPSVGYLILLLNNHYYISGLVAVILTIHAAILIIHMGNHTFSFPGVLLAIVMVYWLAGGAFLIIPACIIAGEVTRGVTARGLMKALAIAVFSLLLPVVAREYLFRDSLLHSYLSESFYAIPVLFPSGLIVLFASFPLLILINHIIPGKIYGTAAGTILIITASAAIAFTSDFRVEKTIEYDNLAHAEKWDEIIRLSEKEPPSDPVSLGALNLALAIKSRLSGEMFRYEQNPGGLFLEYERMGMTPFFASEPYFWLGLNNFARMFAMETMESTPDAKYPSRSFRRVAETFLVSGEYSLALKYLEPLSRTLSHGRWARHNMAAIKTGEIENDRWLVACREMTVKNDFFYDAGRTALALSYLLASNKKNKNAYEYLQAYYLLQKDLDGFLQALTLAPEIGYEKLPVSWQEAGAYIATRLQEVPQPLNLYAIDESVIARLRNYARAFTDNGSDTAAIEKNFGDTYWFFLHYR